MLDKANELKAQLDAGESLPFDKLVPCNIGNPQALGQQPLSFNREVMALLMNPPLMQNEAVLAAFQPDAVERAQKYLDAVAPSVGIGAYTDRCVLGSLY